MRRVLQRGAVAFVVGLLLVRCSTGTEPFVVFVDVSVDSAVVYLGDSLHVDFAAVGANGDTVPDAQVKLVSSDSSVAVMGTDGWVHGIGEGFATIRASDGQANDSVAIAVTPKLTFASISAGFGYSCGVTTGGDGYCWGASRANSATYGRLGTGDTLSHLLPTAVAGGVKFSVIEAELDHTCGLTPTGAAYCWGRGAAGQLGDGLPDSSLVPVAVSGGLQFAEIDLGLAHTCARATSGLGYCWGYNGDGQVGDSTSVSVRTVPTLVAGGLAFRSISAGDRHSCGVTVDSLAYCWGWNDHGQAGDSTTVTPRRFPVAVHTSERFVSIAASSHAYSCAVTPGDTAYCWGHNDDYQLGRAPNLGIDLPVLPVSGGVLLAHVALGGLASCGLTPTGSPYCWGASYLLGQPGSLGGYSEVPLLMTGGFSFSTISIDDDHACGMATDGRAYCWGRNSVGEVGTGRSSVIEPTPVPVIGQP